MAETTIRVVAEATGRVTYPTEAEVAAGDTPEGLAGLAERLGSPLLAWMVREGPEKIQSALVESGWRRAGGPGTWHHPQDPTLQGGIFTWIEVAVLGIAATWPREALLASGGQGEGERQVPGRDREGRPDGDGDARGE